MPWAPDEPLVTVFAPGAQRTRSLSLDTMALGSLTISRRIGHGYWLMACRHSERCESQTQPLLGGGYTVARGSRGGEMSPIPPIGRVSSPDGPPPNLGARFGRILLPRVLLFSVVTTFYVTTFQTDHCFFFRFVLQRNRYIRSVVLVEESSILLLLRCLEASE